MGTLRKHAFLEKRANDQWKILYTWDHRWNLLRKSCSIFWLRVDEKCCSWPLSLKDIFQKQSLRRFLKKVFLENFQNSLENTCARVSILIETCIFIKIDTLAQVFSSKFCKISKNTSGGYFWFFYHFLFYIYLFVAVNFL